MDVELIEFVLTLMQLREQLETRQSSVITKHLEQDWSATKIGERLQRPIGSVQVDLGKGRHGC
jgi:DNA-directed RNA polymerase specialized sigma24 family protein